MAVRSRAPRGRSDWSSPVSSVPARPTSPGSIVIDTGRSTPILSIIVGRGNVIARDRFGARLPQDGDISSPRCSQQGSPERRQPTPPLSLGRSASCLVPCSA